MKSLSRLLLPASVLLLLAGCQVIPEPREDPTRYYTLGASHTAVADTPAAEPFTVGLLPVELPAYLRKGLLVVRKGDNELRFSDYERWAEPLEAGITRLLQSGIQSDARFTVTNQAVSGLRCCEVKVRILQAEGLAPEGASASIRFSATVELHSADGQGRVLTRRTFTAPPQAWDGRSHAALAKGLGEDIELLAREITLLLASEAQH
jgi:uncharacterized lipoprotein YmbA